MRRKVVGTGVGLALALIFGALVDPAPAFARRVVTFEILVEGKLALRGTMGDDGGVRANQVWQYLNELRFEVPDPITVNPAERVPGDFEIRPKTGNPLRATLKGPVRVFCRYGGDVTVKSLELIRTNSEDNWWRIAPSEIERLGKIRRVDATQGVRKVGAPPAAVAKAGDDDGADSPPKPGDGAPDDDNDE